MTREYPEWVPIYSVYDADAPIRFASRLWTKPIQAGIRQRVDNISKRFSGAGWKNLPQELVDKIFGYLLDDLDTLGACSLTCKCLFGATRPLIHQRLVCFGSGARYIKVKGILLSRRKRDHGAFERLINADRSGVLHYTQHLTIKVEDGSLDLRDMQEYLQYLRSITKLRTLALGADDRNPFIPVFGEHLGMFTNTLRHLDIRSARGTEMQILYFVCQFPLLDDLTIVYADCTAVEHGLHVPAITQSPLFRGRLVLAKVHSREFFESLVALPSGFNFHSLELHWCRPLGALLAARDHIATSISYLWTGGSVDSEANHFSSACKRCDCLGL